MQLKEFLSLAPSKLTVSSIIPNKTIDEIELEIRNYLTQRMKVEKEEYSHAKLELVITQYINENIHKWIVEGYVDKKDGTIKKPELTRKLLNDLINLGPIEKFINDPKIDEIRSNGRWIIVVDGKGVEKFPKDDVGNRVKFSSPEEQMTVINKMIPADIAINRQYKLVNCRTFEGYRISLTDPTATSENQDFPDENGYVDFTLRKFRAETFKLSELVKGGSLSDNMAKFLKFIVSRESFAVVGPTFSGKTTLARSLQEYIPDNKRVISIQQPTEQELRKYNRNGELINDRVMWEADEDAIGHDEAGNPIKYTNTVANLSDHTLRNSPEIVLINEIRHPEEFHNAVLIGQAGHSLNTTFHAKNLMQACTIFTNRLISATKQTFEVGLRDTTSIFRFLILQRMLEDGTRRIVEIAELKGVKETNQIEPDINVLYRFIPDKIDYNTDGSVNKIHGHHQKVGNLSEDTRYEFSLQGVMGDKLKEIDPDFETVKNETYNGEGI